MEFSEFGQTKAISFPEILLLFGIVKAIITHPRKSKSKETGKKEYERLCKQCILTHKMPLVGEFPNPPISGNPKIVHADKSAAARFFKKRFFEKIQRS